MFGLYSVTMDKLGFDWCEQQSCAWLVLLDMLTFLRLLCVPPSCDGSLQLRQHMAFQLTLVISFVPLIVWLGRTVRQLKSRSSVRQRCGRQCCLLVRAQTRFVRYLHHLTEGGQFPCNKKKKKTCGRQLQLLHANHISNSEYSRRQHKPAAEYWKVPPAAPGGAQ